MKLRKECQRLGINPCTGVITDVTKRCEIYRERIHEYYEAQRKCTEAKVRNELRPLVHFQEKKKVEAMAGNMLDKQLVDACNSSQPLKAIHVLKKGQRDPNHETLRGITPLLCAVINSSPLEVIDELFALKADVNYINRYGLSPLMVACRMKEPKMIHALFRGGAMPMLQTPPGVRIRTVGYGAIHWCAVHGCEDELR